MFITAYYTVIFYVIMHVLFQQQTLIQACIPDSFCEPFFAWITDRMFRRRGNVGPRIVSQASDLFSVRDKLYRTQTKDTVHEQFLQYSLRHLTHLFSCGTHVVRYLRRWQWQVTVRRKVSWHTTVVFVQGEAFGPTRARVLVRSKFEFNLRFDR